MYKVVYSSDGEMFEVPQHKFEELVLNHNWTQTAPVVTKPAPKVVRKEGRASLVKKSSAKED